MRILSISLLSLGAVLLLGCSSRANDNAHTTATTVVTPDPIQVLTVAPRPAWIEKLLSNPESAAARPTLTILTPRPDESLQSGTVNIRLSLQGAQSSYQLNNSTAATTTVGVVFLRDHVHIVLDNLSPEDYEDLTKPFELHNLTPGRHTLRIFAVRPWHESYKNDSSFQQLVFNVTGAIEGGRVAESGAADPAKALLTYNTPQGEYNGTAPGKAMVADHIPDAKFDKADPIMIDFWISNAKLKSDGGEYRIRYFIDDDEARYADKWEPVWLRGWTPGKHTVRVELLGADQYPVKNGGYINITTREITVVR